MRRLVLLGILGVLASAPAASARIDVERIAPLRTNAATEPLGIDAVPPRFTWALESVRRGVMQTAYRVTVGASEADARAGRLWDSGRIESPGPSAVYAGPPLRSRTRYFWTVQVWATGGFAAGAPRPTWFETAYLDPSDWRGDWIAGPERRLTRLTPEEGQSDDAAIRAAGELCRPVGWITSGFSARPNEQGECRELRPAPLLRKTFEVAKTVARARVYASGLGYARVFVGREPTSSRVLDPAFTNYAKTVSYTTDDVTSRLVPGRNVIAVELGSGRFDDATRTWDWGWDDAEWRASPRVRLDLRIDYADGTAEVVRTDDSWKVSTDGPHRFDSLYLGETYDARRARPLWSGLRFDDSRWAAARVVSGPAGVPRAQAQQAIQVMQRRPPGTRSEPAPGVFVYDVGANVVGWAAIRVRAPAGTAVEVFYSERLDGNGRASTDGNVLVYGQLQTDYYVARGGGADEVWTPSFSYKGFQYVQISGPSGAPLPAGAAVSVERIEEVRSALEPTAGFRSDQPTLDRIHASTLRAVQGNLHGIVTDTPVYEKNAWTGDAALMAGTTPLLLDAERLYLKMMQDMRDAQTPEGEVPLLCPSNRNYGYVGKPYFKPPECCGATPAWDAFWFEIPWESYRHYGDARTLAAAFPGMQRYLDEWIPRWTGKDGDAFAHTLTSGLGDWLPPKGVPTLDALVSTAYYAHLVQVAADTAAALGRDADAARYRGLVARIRSDFDARFLGPDGVYRETPAEPFAQSAQVLPLAFGLVPDDRRAALVARLVDDLDVRGGNAYVGVIGARHVLPVLTAEGRHDVAFEAATQTDEPSWGFWTDVLHFTSLGESWPADTRSRNHHFFGAIVQWLYEDLAGMRPLAPGYARILIEPRIPTKGIGHVSAWYASVRGRIASEWRRGPEGLELNVTVPPNATARVVVPAARARDVREVATGSSLPAQDAPSVTLESESPGRVVYEVGSGRYAFVVLR